MKKLKEKCGVFGIHDIEDASALTALGKATATSSGISKRFITSYFL